MEHPDEHVSTPAKAAFTRLVLLVFQLNGLLLAEGDRLAGPAGQTSARWQVMGVIDHGPQTVSQIARTMGLRRQSVQRTADLLAADGTAEYIDNPGDRRAQLLALTPSGRRALRKVERAQFEWARNHGEAIGRKSIESAADALEEIIAQLRRSD